MITNINQVIKTVEDYYSISGVPKLGAPVNDFNHEKIKNVISKKIDFLSDQSQICFLTKNWSYFFESLETSSKFKYENANFYQYPSLRLNIVHDRGIEEYFEYKAFSLCVSLLAPVYTYFFSSWLTKKIVVNDMTGQVPFGTYRADTFNDSAHFKIDIDRESIVEKFLHHFKNYNYLEYSKLEEHKLISAPPLGINTVIKTYDEYSLFELLFEPNKENILDITF